MKHAAISVAADAVGSVKQKAKMHMQLAGNGGGKVSSFQFWRWVVLLMVIGSTLAAGMWGLLAGLGDFIRFQDVSPFFVQSDDEPAFLERSDDQCMGKRVYMYDLPPQFNADILEMMCVEKNGWLRMCEGYINNGFGFLMEQNELVPQEAWFQTEQFSLEVILHERFKRYKCLTNNPDIADLYFLPYYVGLDLCINLFSDLIQMRDLLVERFMGWLVAQPCWVRSQGNNHVIALSRIIWDFTRQVESEGWGNSLLASFELQNVTKVLIERDPRSDFKQMAIPYPTAFHPSSDSELEIWQKKISETKREYLISFAGAPRNSTENPMMALRDVLFQQCLNAPEKCTSLSCHAVDCTKNSKILTDVFMSSTFCFQPPGDSPTRKGVFDCIVAGTIPVFFNPASAYTQYLWHLPEDGSSYSVFVEDVDVLSGKVNVVDYLSNIPESKIKEMQAVLQEKVIPSIIYDMPGRDPNKKTKDAFDLMIEHLLDPDFQTYPTLDAPKKSAETIDEQESPKESAETTDESAP